MIFKYILFIVDIYVALELKIIILKMNNKAHFIVEC